MKSRALTPDAGGPCPTFFRGCVARAKTTRAGYSDPGYHIAIHASDLVDDDDLVQELEFALEAPDAAEHVWRWLRLVLPRCMALVPSRRKATFLRGVIQAIEEGRV